jgi:hypothetical protein
MCWTLDEAGYLPNKTAKAGTTDVDASQLLRKCTKGSVFRPQRLFLRLILFIKFVIQ